MGGMYNGWVGISLNVAGASKPKGGNEAFLDLQGGIGVFHPMLELVHLLVPLYLLSMVWAKENM